MNINATLLVEVVIFITFVMITMRYIWPPLTKIIEESATTRTTERGGRADDKRTETAMEDRKKQGYF